MRTSLPAKWIIRIILEPYQIWAILLIRNLGRFKIKRKAQWTNLPLLTTFFIPLPQGRSLVVSLWKAWIPSKAMCAIIWLLFVCGISSFCTLSNLVSQTQRPIWPQTRYLFHHEIFASLHYARFCHMVIIHFIVDPLFREKIWAYGQVFLDFNVPIMPWNLAMWLILCIFYTFLPYRWISLHNKPITHKDNNILIV